MIRNVTSQTEIRICMSVCLSDGDCLNFWLRI